MSKKTVKSKEISEGLQKMNRYFLVGDFFLARKCAKNILLAPHDEKEAESAKAILKKTWPDSQALLAGALCLLFSGLAAFIAGNL